MGETSSVAETATYFIVIVGIASGKEDRHARNNDGALCGLCIRVFKKNVTLYMKFLTAKKYFDASHNRMLGVIVLANFCYLTVGGNFGNGQGD